MGCRPQVMRQDGQGRRQGRQRHFFAAGAGGKGFAVGEAGAHKGTEGDILVSMNKQHACSKHVADLGGRVSHFRPPCMLGQCKGGMVGWRRQKGGNTQNILSPECFETHHIA
eukprot:801448-Pelagomonas_calceolata.AAC.9